MTQYERRRDAGMCVDCGRDMRATNQATGNKVAASISARCLTCNLKRRDAAYNRKAKAWK